MLSDRWGAVTREHLLNPHLYVRALLSDAYDAAIFPSGRLNGRLHHVLNVQRPHRPPDDDGPQPRSR